MGTNEGLVFLKRAALFVSIGLALYIGIFASLDRLFNSDPGNCVYLWGDSQMYQGFDLAMIKARTGKTPLSAAAHGSGVYDFLVFCDKLPQGAEAYVSLSKPVQIRDLAKDYNRTGLSLFAWARLLEHGYSVADLFRIFLQNDKFPKSIFHSYIDLYPYSAGIEIGQGLSEYELAYSRVPEYIGRKQDLYLLGVETLLRKGCKLHLVEFPYHRLLSDIEGRSKLKELTDRFRERIRKLTGFTEVNFVVKSDRILMHDLTHLNAYGARLFTASVIEANQEERRSIILYRLNGGTCD